MSRIAYICCLVPLIAVFGMNVGCQEQTPYETQKPLIDEDIDNDGVDDDLENDMEEAGEDLEELGEDAADAVTPDRDIANVETPVGDVRVSEDPATGDKKVDVDTDDPNDQ